MSNSSFFYLRHFHVLSEKKKIFAKKSFLVPILFHLLLTRWALFSRTSSDVYSFSLSFIPNKEQKYCRAHFKVKTLLRIAKPNFSFLSDPSPIISLACHSLHWLTNWLFVQTLVWSRFWSWNWCKIWSWSLVIIVLLMFCRGYEVESWSRFWS